eukprot:gnl/MRDRNA2_/MRDRNA2_66397_c0_seq2.p1 gnl/MRDRNA2_/MRDRNA2_66397_c0~~gnl/MRDRNA2_/MRDRNA2_66397_c0_seq2.p1  ORF type:complete len:283 (-),score=43.63 gnl/MRDRNA2_/MRDRNA2_66397_c0_seq2:58-885(-)
MASASDCVGFFGFEPGCIPPVGLRSGVDVWLDESLKSHSGQLGFSAGSFGSSLICTWKALEAYYGRDRWLMASACQIPVPIEDQVSELIKRKVVPRFVCADPALGRLVQRLRVLDLNVSLVDVAKHAGVDVKHRRHCSGESEVLRDLVGANDCDMVVLTQSPMVNKKTAPQVVRDAVYRLSGTSLEQQFWEVLAVFGINGRSRCLTCLHNRCHMCNGKLESINRKEVERRQFKTYDVRDEYFLCTGLNCEMKFWHSKTYKDLRQEVQLLVDDALF